ncbi:flavodoxin family protein, partial [Candidatus Bathyarchaeota archaeon]|nr:flavodoxin family protein [Candidatus Bathyarchaeota archaeon]
MILGISASGRRATRDDNGKLLCGATEELVKQILEKSGEPHDYISLSDKNIQPCRGCVRCAGDNVCVIKDDWAEIRDRMMEADAVVFGAPDYYGYINGLGHAFLERTFSLRHRERFP